MARVHPKVRTPFLAALCFLLAALGSLAAGPRPAAAQDVVVDEGTFTVFLSGREVGSETFTIRRQGSGAEATYLANAVVTTDGAAGSQMRPTLRTGADHVPLMYENAIEGGDVSEVGIRNVGRRFVATISSTAGERERELRAQQGSRLLDRWVAHQYWFIRDAAEGARIPVLIPRTGDQATLTVSSIGNEPLDLGGQRVQARRVRLTTGSDTRDVWFDPQGRVLQVEVPGQEYRAVRRSG